MSNTIMAVKEFAEKYVDCDVFKAGNDAFFGVCIGYIDKNNYHNHGHIIVSIKDSPIAREVYQGYQYGCSTTGISTYLSKTIISGAITFIPYSSLLVSRKPIVVSPYPHICKYCKLPARKLDGLSLCSNMKCKTMKQARKIINTYPRAKRGVDADKYIICPICGDRAEYTKEHLPHGSDLMITYQCPLSHVWKHYTEVGDKVINRYGTHAFNDRNNFDTIGR